MSLEVLVSCHGNSDDDGGYDDDLVGQRKGPSNDALAMLASPCLITHRCNNVNINITK